MRAKLFLMSGMWAIGKNSVESNREILAVGFTLTKRATVLTVRFSCEI